MAPRTVKLAASCTIAHAVLFSLMKLDQGGAYAFGEALGKVTWMTIVAVALLRVVKYGWGASMFVICASFVRETSACVNAVNALPEETGGVLGVLLFLIDLPLLAALGFLLPASSRAPFREKRKSPVKQTAADT
jgi:hypothetical protein